MNYYLLTIKNNKTGIYTDKEGIDDILCHISKAADHIGISRYENDSKMKLHSHSILGFKKIPFFKSCQRKGYTVHFQHFDILDYNKVVRYINKEEDPLISNHYYHNYSMVH